MMNQNSTPNCSASDHDHCNVLHDSLKKSRSFKIMFCNAFGFLGHKNAIEELVFATEPDILGVAEMNLHDGGYEELELAIEGYNYELVQQNRDSRHARGGVAMYYKHNVKAKVIKKFARNEVEFITLQVSRGAGKPFLASTFYRKPNVTKEDTEMAINELIISQAEHVVVGDFNKHPSDGMLLNLAMNYCQLINQNTRITTHSQTLIDHIYVNQRCNYTRFGVLAIPVADHSVIYCERRLARYDKLINNCKTVKIRRWKNFNKIQFQQELATKDITFNCNQDIHDFIGHVNACLDVCAPPSQKSVKLILQPKWLSDSIKIEIRSRNKLLRQFWKSRFHNLPDQDRIFEKYKSQRNKVGYMIRFAKQSLYNDLFSNCKDPSKFWQLVSPFLPSKHTKKDDIDANEWNGKFVENATNLIKEKLPEELLVFPIKQSSVPFNLPQVNLLQTEEYIAKLNNTKSIGSDGISVKMIKDGGDPMARNLNAIARWSFENFTFPLAFKFSKVVAIPKKDGTQRPITIISNASKILESYFCDELLKHLAIIDYWAPQQFGFRKNHSTQEALLTLQSHVLKAANGNTFAAALAIDFAKAFDTVDHTLLLRKFREIGATMATQNWLLSYLSDRMQFVQLPDGQKSNLLYVLFGVPQGSRLGPICFAIYIMDICKLKLIGKLVIYADDVTLVYTGTQAEIEMAMNSDLAMIAEFANSIRLIISESKTKFILFNGQKQYRHMKVQLNGSPIEMLPSLKLLGVTFQSNHSFNIHIGEVHKKMSQRIGLLSRLRHMLPLKPLNSLYKATIAPLATYCSSLWSQSRCPQLIQLERLQKRAARFILFQDFRETSLPLFIKLKWPKLTDTWQYNMLLAIHKCVLNLSSTLLNCCFLRRRVTRATRVTDEFAIDIPHINRNYFANSIFANGCKEYNTLAKEVRSLENFSIFKKTLKTIVFHYFN